MSAFVFVWNPNCMSVLEDEFEDDIRNLHQNGFYEFVWSIWDAGLAKEGDTAYLFKTGTLDSGICGRGVISSDVFQGEHWRYDGEPCNYVRISADYLINPSKTRYLSMIFLNRVLPEFKWSGGHSGVMLSADCEKKLDEIWNNYLDKLGDIFDGDRAAKSSDI